MALLIVFVSTKNWSFHDPSNFRSTPTFQRFLWWIRSPTSILNNHYLISCWFKFSCYNLLFTFYYTTFWLILWNAFRFLLRQNNRCYVIVQLFFPTVFCTTRLLLVKVQSALLSNDHKVFQLFDWSLSTLLNCLNLLLNNLMLSYW